MIFDTRPRTRITPAKARVDPYEIAAQEDRSAPRSRIVLPGKLRLSRGRKFDTVVHDLSLSGFSASSINKMPPGSRCWLYLEGLESLEAEVIWWDRSLVGCAFQNMLSSVVHEALLARHTGSSAFRMV